MRTRTVMEEHYTGCQQSTPFVLNGPTQFFLVFPNTFLTLLWSLVALIPPSALFSCPVREKSCHQLSGTQRLFKPFLLVW
jgi:hypothetical protein